MPYRMPPEGIYDQSRRQLGRSMLHNPLRDFLRDLASRDRVVFYDDFLVDTINLDNYVVGASGTGVAFNVTTVTVPGAAIATSGTTSGQICGIFTPAIWTGDANASVEMRFKINTVASMVMEMGFVDSGGTGATLRVTDIDVPTFANTNAALWTIDTSQTHTGMAFGSVGSFTSQTVATTLLTTGVTAPTADTWMTVKVQLLTDPDETGKTKAYCFINSKLRARHEVAAGAINGQIPLAAWFAFGTRTSADRIGYIDYIRVAQDRVALMAASE